MRPVREAGRLEERVPLVADWTRRDDVARSVETTRVTGPRELAMAVQEAGRRDNGEAVSVAWLHGGAKSSAAALQKLD